MLNDIEMIIIIPIKSIIITVPGKITANKTDKDTNTPTTKIIKILKSSFIFKLPVPI